MENKSFTQTIKEPQNIIAIGVTIISICALVVSIMQTQIMSEQRALMHQHAKAEVWPRLAIGYTKSHEENSDKLTEFLLTLGNAGVGPAIITDVRVSYQGKPMKNWWDLFRAIGLPKEIPTYIGNIHINNSIARIGGHVTFLNLDENLPLANFLWEKRADLKFEIWYNSIYGEKWKLTYVMGNGNTEEANPDFKLPPEEQFEN